MRLAAAGCLAVALAGCQDESGLGNARAYQPIPEATLSLMDHMGTTKYSPVLIRTFKKEAELEVWKMKADGTYGLFEDLSDVPLGLASLDPSAAKATVRCPKVFIMLRRSG